MGNLGDPVGQARKKWFLIVMIEAATDSLGPYILQISEASHIAVGYLAAKDLFSMYEPSVLVRSKSNSNKACADGKQNWDEQWNPSTEGRRRWAASGHGSTTKV